MGMTDSSYTCRQTLGTPSLTGYKPEVIFRDECNGVLVDRWKADIPLRCHSSSLLAVSCWTKNSCMLAYAYSCRHHITIKSAQKDLEIKKLIVLFIISVL